VDLATPVDSPSVADSRANDRVRARNPWRWAAMAAAGLVVSSAACTLLLDRSATQCASDSDCSKFGAHPYCVNSVCVDSGLGPDPCFFGTPKEQQDFENQCTTSYFAAYDNCKLIKLCPGTADPPLMPPPTPDAGTSVAPSAIDGGDGGLPNCIDPASGRGPEQVLIMTGSSNFPPLLSKLAPLVIAPDGGSPTGPIPIFQVTNSCTGVKAVVNSVAIHDPATAAQKYAAFFNADGTQTPCLLGGSVPVDLGESDIYATTCGVTVPTDVVSEHSGPIQAMAFVVPENSTQRSISAEAAREVFGMGGNGGVAKPWTDPNYYYVRNVNTGTQQMIGLAIGVPADKFWGTDEGSALAVDQALKTTGNTEAAIGIISVDWYDLERGNLNALAFQATGQEVGFLPDSTIDSTDKQNVRDGHYPIWGPIHFLTSNSISSAAVAFLSTVDVPNLPKSVADAYIGASLVPPCAMNVQRTTELGPLSAAGPHFHCDCYFESKQAGGVPPECVPCDKVTNPCSKAPRLACNYNFCEVQ